MMFYSHNGAKGYVSIGCSFVGYGESPAVSIGEVGKSGIAGTNYDAFRVVFAGNSE